jgi:hypothetical protein
MRLTKKFLLTISTIYYYIIIIIIIIISSSSSSIVIIKCNSPFHIKTYTNSIFNMYTDVKRHT